MKANYIQKKIHKYAQRIGIEDFSPHSCRHWFTTHLRKAGMPREFIQELRGDRRRDAIDIYDHIDLEELQKSYLEHIPWFGL